MLQARLAEGQGHLVQERESTRQVVEWGMCWTYTERRRILLSDSSHADILSDRKHKVTKELPRH